LRDRPRFASGRAVDLDPSQGRAAGLDPTPNRAVVGLPTSTGGALPGGGGTPLWEEARRRAPLGTTPLGLLSSCGAPQGVEWRGGTGRGGEGGDTAEFVGWRTKSG
jgi:hypothetical protein